MRTEFDFEIRDPNGIHARPAGLLVQKAQEYQSNITIVFNGASVDAKRIFSVLSMGASQGDTIRIVIDGNDAQEASLGLQTFLKESL
ncbi:HPr family phosphocarrier protein [Bifidobacterium aquikefiricola]|uniref:HPr family phosphocarrier protein n=1 Tax=Bifidobacterium aquikefiricola TaxID=3059038 RepID=A0AB39U8E6_9BIFI